MIAFRHTDPRFPFLREDGRQPAARWNAAGQLTHYFCDTPDGAWAEFLRHEEITESRDLATVQRALWTVEIGEPPARIPLPAGALKGGRESWVVCRRIADRYRGRRTGFAAPAAALRRGGAHGWRVDHGLRPGPVRDGRVIVLFGRRPDLIGWAAAVAGRPGEALLRVVRHF